MRGAVGILAVVLLACSDPGDPISPALHPGFGDVLKGSFTLQNELDLESLDGVKAITGNLTISAEGMTAIELPDLQIIQGDLSISGSTLTTLDFPSLQSVGKSVSISNTQFITDVSFLSFLTKVHGSLNISQTKGLDISALSGVQTVSDNFTVLSTDLSDLSAFSNLSSVGGFFFVNSNQNLTNLGLDHLSFVGSFFQILSNPVLPTCQAQNLASQLIPIPVLVSIAGNDDAAVCP